MNKKIVLNKDDVKKIKGGTPGLLDTIRGPKDTVGYAINAIKDFFTKP